MLKAHSIDHYQAALLIHVIVLHRYWVLSSLTARQLLVGPVLDKFDY
jgi:hypothetical protein